MSFQFICISFTLHVTYLWPKNVPSLCTAKREGWLPIGCTMSTQIDSSICSSSTVFCWFTVFLLTQFVSEKISLSTTSDSQNRQWIFKSKTQLFTLCLYATSDISCLGCFNLDFISVNITCKWGFLEPYQPRYTYKRMVESYEESLHWSLVVLVNRPDSCPVALMANARVKRWLKLKSTEWRSVVSRTWLWDPGKKCQKLWSQKSFWANCIYFTNPNWSNALFGRAIYKRIRDLTVEITLVHLMWSSKKARHQSQIQIIHYITLHCQVR